MKTFCTLAVYPSLGQPELSFEQCGDLAVEFGMEFLGLRVLENTLDLPKYFKSRKFRPTPVPVRVLGSSLRLSEATEPEIEQFMDYALLADELNAPYVRVFGGGKMGKLHRPKGLPKPRCL